MLDSSLEIGGEGNVNLQSFLGIGQLQSSRKFSQLPKPNCRTSRSGRCVTFTICKIQCVLVLHTYFKEISPFSYTNRGGITIYTFYTLPYSQLHWALGEYPPNRWKLPRCRLQQLSSTFCFTKTLLGEVHIYPAFLSWICKWYVLISYYVTKEPYRCM